jgi:hypothetical protein
MVAPYIAPDNTSQNGAAYKSNLDNAIVAGARVAVAFLPQAQASPNMTVRVLAGALLNGTTLTEVAAQNTGTVVAPVTHPRIDRVVLNPATGAVSVVTGVENASPVAPAIPADRLPLCRFQLATSTTQITNAMIVDERVGAGGGTIPDLSVTARKESDDPWSSVASASTVDLGAINSRNALITGTTTITSFGNTGGEGRAYRVRFGGALTLTHNAPSLILPTAANIVTAAGDTAEFVKESGTGNWRCTDYQRANGQPLAGAGAMVGTPQIATYTTNTNLTTTIPHDDTIPQNTEGTQILSLARAAASASNRIRIRVTGFGWYTSGGSAITLAIFQSGSANAIQATGYRNGPGGDSFGPLVAEVEFSPGSTSSVTYSVRVGADSGNARMNGNVTTGRFFGGAAATTMIVEEFTP